MADTRASEEVFNVAVQLEDQLKDFEEGAKKEEIKAKIERLLDLAIEIEQKELQAKENPSEVGGYVFIDLSEPEKLELEDTISAHLARALELLKEKGKETKHKIDENTKRIIEEISERVNNIYDSSIDFATEKGKAIKSQIEEKKAEKKAAKEKAIEQLKALGKDDEIIGFYDAERKEIEKELDGHYDQLEENEDRLKHIKKQTKALTKYEKKGFFSRFMSNFAELDSREELSEEQKRAMIENGEVPKKQGFFSKVKQAFSMTKEQGKDIKSGNEELKTQIMEKYEADIEAKNGEITELENILAENEEQRDALEAEKKAKLIEIVKSGKLKAKELQEMIDNEILVCSNPHMIVAQAKLSSLKDKLARVFSWGKEKEEEKDVAQEAPKPVEKDNPRNSGMDR